MKKLFILGFVLFLIYAAKAQDMVRWQEFQASLDIARGIRGVSAYYKLNFKNNQDKYWRTRIGSSSDDYYNHHSDLVQTDSKLILGIGLEKRIPPTKKSQLSAGVDIYGIRETFQAYHSDSLSLIILDSEKLGFGIAFPIGIIFNKNAKWYVGVETIPGFQFQKVTKNKFNLISNPNRTFGFYNHSFALCFGYRIPTKRI